ncbi:hypothetical protein JXA80_00060 [bacterium]|nr:hypothetical protein [candidate division CSSED10-310 bacterium]
MKRIATLMMMIGGLVIGGGIGAADADQQWINEEEGVFLAGDVPAISEAGGAYESAKPVRDERRLLEARERLLEARRMAFGGADGDRQEFADDFEDGTMDDWLDGGGGFSASVTNSTAAAGTVYSMTMTGGTGGHFNGRYHLFTPCTPDYLSVWLNSGSETLSDTYFVVGDSSIASNNGIVFLYAKDTGYWNLYSGTAHYSLERYGAFLWNHHEFLLDWNTRLVDWYVDGVLQYAGIPFRSSSTTAVDRVHAYHYTNSTGWFDEYFIGDFVVPTPTPEPTATPSGEPCIHDGDVTQDGELSVGDAQRAFYIVLGMVTPTIEEACAADCNGDNEISAGDSQQIFQTVLMLDSCVDPLTM